MLKVASVCRRVPVSGPDTPEEERQHLSIKAIEVLPAVGWVGEVPRRITFAFWPYYNRNQSRFRTLWHCIKKIKGKQKGNGTC